jgi:cellulose synthase/poly-beta-1,6-N-acetylglucosamine synthase-like glycosyltransferase
VCAFRRDVLLGIGGFGRDTLVEDFDATLAVIRARYHVAYEPQAVAETDSPPTWSALGKQRLRWSRGGLQAARKHLRMFFAPSTGLVGMFWLPYTFLIGFGGVLVEAVAIVTLPILVLASGAPLATLKAGLPFIIVMELIAASQYIVTLFIGRQFKADLILAALLIKPFNFFLALIRMRALVHELRATRASW